MSIEEAMEWCIAHGATVEFTRIYSVDEGSRTVVMLGSAYKGGIQYIGTPDIEGIISCVTKAKKAMWGEWQYQRMFGVQSRQRTPTRQVEPHKETPPCEVFNK